MDGLLPARCGNEIGNPPSYSARPFGPAVRTGVHFTDSGAAADEVAAAANMPITMRGKGKPQLPGRPFPYEVLEMVSECCSQRDCARKLQLQGGQDRHETGEKAVRRVLALLRVHHAEQEQHLEEFIVFEGRVELEVE